MYTCIQTFVTKFTFNYYLLIIVTVDGNDSYQILTTDSLYNWLAAF